MALEGWEENLAKNIGCFRVSDTFELSLEIARIGAKIEYSKRVSPELLD